MNRFLLIFRNIWFYRKAYLAVLAGVIISTAVLTGALIVGDSVRFSLQQLTEIRLGKVRYAMQTSDRFFRQELSAELSAQTQLPVASALLAGGIAINPVQNLRINRVQIIGIDQGFGKFWNHPPALPRPDEAIISKNISEQLNLKQGDELLLRIEKKGKAPPGAPFVSEKLPSAALRLTITEVADDAEMGRFSLKNNQSAPYNVFISLNQMVSLLDVPGSANLLLTSGRDETPGLASLLDSALQNCWKPADAGLIIRKLPLVDAFQITSDRIFFDDSAANAIISTVPGCQPFLTYLVNSISSPTKSTPYSFVTAAGESWLQQPLGQGQIMINDWLAADLGVRAGDSVMMRYYLMGPLRLLREDSARFVVKSIFEMKTGLADRQLMPDFPGMSDAGNCRDWETGAPVNLKNIRDKDEQYWTDYRGTPKAFVAIDAGRKIWDNRFGSYTAFRFSAPENEIPGIEHALMMKIKPAQSGLFFTEVYSDGQTAAINSTDFGELFLSLSFFILLSALLLTAMLFSLLAGMRMSETGLLSALGFSRRIILTIFAGETFFVTLVGAVIGVAGGILYNYLVIAGLNTIWHDAVNTSLLVMKIIPATLLTGAAIGVVASMAVLLFILWRNLKKPLSGLVKGIDGIQESRFRHQPRKILVVSGLICVAVSISIMLWLIISGRGMSSSLSLIAGGLMLPGGWILMSQFLLLRSQLLFKNLALRRGRTISAIALLSLGSFTIIITGANKKSFFGSETARHSGTGGFLIWAESTIPILNDLNTATGAAIFGLQDEELLKPVRYIQLTSREGDDASCLNLNQVSQPGMLGVPEDLFNQLNCFSFLNLDSTVNPKHPWEALSHRMADDVIPGFADQTVITWGIRKKIGDTLFYRDESGRILKIKLVGGFDNSIFQGNLLVSDSLLRLHYPSTGGSRIMLIDGPVNQQDTIAERLETLFRDFGLMATPASTRLASFNAVTNTYLSVFMLLGGLGIIIGTIGLGIALLRNISQRKQELALYSVLGFQKQFVFKLILAEHSLILFAGIFLGLVASLPVILPLIISPVSSVPWLFILAILLLVFMNGFLWIYFAAKTTIKQNPLQGLREE